MAEAEKEMGTKYKNALQSHKEIEAKLSSMIIENSKVKEELKTKIAEL